MAAPSVTYTFSNSTTADATEVNQNFTDIINGITDGTKDLTMNLLTVNGAASFNGNVTLGNATGDDVSFTGRVATDIDPKTAASNDLGDATQTWRALYLDNTTTDGGAIYFDGGSTEFIKASADGADLQLGGFTGFDIKAGCSIKTFGRYLEAKSANYTITDTDGVSVVLMTTGSSTDTTVTLPTPANNTGRIITLKKVDSGTKRAFLTESGSETIDGFSTIVCGIQYDSVTVQCDGTTWHILNRRNYGPWTSFTPSGGGLTVTASNAYWKKVGGEIMFYGDMTVNTSASEMTFVLPNSLTLGGPASNTIYYGDLLIGASIPMTRVVARGVQGEGFLTFIDYYDGNANDDILGATGDNANSMIATGSRVSFRFGPMPISEWQDIA